jgi:hypothetical protein
MSLRSALAAGLLAVLPLAGASQARTFPVDDTGTVVSQPVARTQWRQLVPGRQPDHTVEATVRVDVRLDLAPWLHRRARLYLAMAPATQTPVRARWTTQGRLLPANVRSGERVVVYEGPAAPAVFTESLALTLEADGTRLTQVQDLQFSFELELLP